MKPKFLTVEDITRDLGIGRTTAYQLIRKINHTKIGRRILVAEEDLLDYLHQNSQVRNKANQTQNNNM